MDVGIGDVLVVVGHHAGPVAAVVSRLRPGGVRAVLADGWELGNGASLAAAEEFLHDQDLFMLVTADHVFGDTALHNLVRAGEPAVLVDPDPSPGAWDEGCRVRVRGQVAVAFGKHIDEQRGGSGLGGP